MNERLKKLRKALQMTQQEFANNIGIARGNIAAYEVAKNSPSDAVISLICTKFGRMAPNRCGRRRQHVPSGARG